MIPIHALLTPYEAPAIAPVGLVGERLGGLGDFLEKRRENEIANELERQRQDQSYELGKGNLAETSRYHDLLGAQRQDTLDEKANAAKDKQREGLFNALRKAQTPDEKASIIKEFKRLGDTVEETETALPAPAPEPIEPTPAKGAPKTRLEPPEFAGWGALGNAKPSGFRKSLDAYMASGAGGASSGEEPTASPPGVLPPEIAALVPEGSSSVKPSTSAEAPKNRGGKFTIRDAQGNIIHEYDAPLEKQKVLTQITAMGAPFVKNAGFPEDEKAAQAAAEYASTLVGVLPPDKIPDAYLKAYQENLSGYKKKHIEGQGGGGPAGPSKTDIKMQQMANDDTNRIIARVRQTSHVTAAEDAEESARRALAALDAAAQGGMQQLEAVKQHMVELSGKVVTDREMSQFMGSTGYWNEAQAKLSKYIASGEQPKEFLHQLRGVLETGLQRALARKNAAAQNAYQQSMLSSGDPVQAAIARGNFNGDFSVGEAPAGAGSIRSLAKPKATGQAAPAPISSGEDERKKALLKQLEGR
jgi:hypothetical protein